MGKKKNIAVRLQNWMDSVAGQTFLNYAYSWGAAVVILGALFKLTHLKGADIALFLGMGTEVVVFFLSAFDRPFDKSEDGKELPEDSPIFDDDEEEEEETVAPQIQGGGTIIINGGGGVAASSVAASAAPAEGASVAAAVSGIDVAGLQNLSANPEMVDATSAYVDQLKNLTEVLSKVSEQSTRLTRDSEEMMNLNRTLTGINSVYELQLKAVSGQIGTIDEINDQTKRLARQIEELNKVYARMLEAMTVNMSMRGISNNEG